MFPKLSGKPIRLNCTEQVFSEFPDLLFGKANDNGMFFDATSYLKDKPFTVDNFFCKCEWMLKSLIKSYKLEEDKCFQINHDGHILIDGNLVYLFLSFVEQDFLAYMCDRCHDLFTEGVAISDSYILHHAYERLDRESIDKIRNNGK